MANTRIAMVFFLVAIAFMISTIVVAVRLRNREDDIDNLKREVTSMNDFIASTTTLNAMRSKELDMMNATMIAKFAAETKKNMMVEEELDMKNTTLINKEETDDEALEMSQADNKDLRAQLEMKQVQIDNLSAELDNPGMKQAEIDRLNAELAESMAAGEMNQVKINELSAELADSETEIDELIQGVIRFLKKNNDLAMEGETKQAEIDRLNADLVDSMTEGETKQVQINNLSTQLAESMTAGETKQTQIIKLIAETGELSDAVNELTAENGELSVDLAEATTAVILKLGENNDLIDELAESMAEVELKLGENNDLKDQLAAYRELAAAKEVIIKNLIDENKEFTVNPCEGEGNVFAEMLGGLLNTNCFEDGSDGTDGTSAVAITVPPQAGADVTVGAATEYVVEGQFTVGNGPEGFENLLVPKPIMTSFSVAGLCPVNIHWHVGTEHRSEGQYDENGTGPIEVENGGQCKLYDETDEKFTKAFDWKYCENMEVGQTYEVHWPHSKLGACGTRWQYQNPFEDGVTCDLTKLENDRELGSPVLSQHVGVQAQVFVVVNDEDYYYPNLIGGAIVNGNAVPPMGEDIAIYTGSTTGTSRDNTVCSTWGPITWQVDRTCHMISASSFDKMCMDMKGMAADLTEDLEPGGSRPIVDEKLAIAQEP